MATITIALDDGQLTELKRLATQQGQTIEEAIHDLLTGVLLEERTRQPGDGTPGASLALAGIIDDPTIRPLTAREIDQVGIGR